MPLFRKNRNGKAACRKTPQPEDLPLMQFVALLATKETDGTPSVRSHRMPLPGNSARKAGQISHSPGNTPSRFRELKEGEHEGTNERERSVRAEGGSVSVRAGGGGALG